MGAEGGNACPHTSHTTLDLSSRIDSPPISPKAPTTLPKEEKGPKGIHYVY